MYNKRLYTSLFLLLLVLSSLAQSDTPSLVSLTGTLLDEHTQNPLPYANIVVEGKNKVITTNEKGYFLIRNLEKSDTLNFHYIGYEQKKICVCDLQQGSLVYLKEAIISLNEFFVFSKDYDVKEIVKNVLKNKDKNYQSTLSKKQLFVRHRYISNVDKISIKFKKSSFSHLDEKMTKVMEQKIPKQSISYTDFLGDIYTSNNDNDTLKISPIKIVRLKDKNVADLEQLEKVFTNLFSNTKENEYWKLKSGIIGGKIDTEITDPDADLDSLSNFHKNNFTVKTYAERLHKRFDNILDDKKKWDFLHNTGNYEYTLVGGTKVNGEDVFIIDFKPKKSGELTGRLYITTNTYALVKADFKYDEGKTGTNIQLFGVGYTLNQLDISIYFEKKDDSYQLKYYAQKTGNKISFDRNVSLIKKRKRFLIDKELNEIKVGLNMVSREESSFEVVVIDEIKISNQTYANFKQKDTFKIIYVDKFNDNIWKGYNIIEPIQQMRDYKKTEY
ncbi:MAG: carboxypeptidase-like regulatory domain-containing protein [Flavobacteriales bacterium]|nr:carboxypeptidase-like regulatory domain-containing protein [Flavobacteriales bacterium]MCW8913716.1 carboxypeptidase-like regulatory domain-containing protein [Flavobacteriales bacterium]MCW8937888.1 carboxypeptidase-like regulatory domain-containing protein [Flavobacteriales bacterium]MCW8967320.1 carboxypeptidase-like regulatory domain-containing protein [Flavobacteriales bacterium]MCW8990888.1 carboxypeptidase-like regulatory domain-containing protein [Flavobacteriales bacterium]